MGLSVCALVAAVCVQVICSVIVMIIYGVAQGIKASAAGVSLEEMMVNLTANIGEITGIILVVGGVLLLFVFVPWFYFGCGRQKITGESMKRAFSPRALLMVLAIAAGLNCGINCLLQLVYVEAPQLLEDYMELMEISGLGVNFWANAAAVILAPLGEELIFRGVAFFYACKAVSGMKNPRAAFWIANCTQALLFGIYHMNLVQGLYAFFIGLALGYLRQKYNSLLPGMLAHLIFNGISTVLGEVIYVWIPDQAVWYALVGAAGITLTLAAILLNGPAVAKNERNIA